MSIFSNDPIDYTKEIRPFLALKDGKTHILSFLPPLTFFSPENSHLIDDILSQIQDDGYKIVDVKFEYSSRTTCFILYK